MLSIARPRPSILLDWKAEDVKEGRGANSLKPLLKTEEIASDPQRLASYAGVFFPGGHAPKVDLLSSRDVGSILMAFHKAKKPTAIVCHAPILLLTAFPGGWTPGREPTEGEKEAFIYKGYNATIGSVVEEKILENFIYLKGRKLKFYVAPELRRAGLSVDTTRFPTSSQVVVDRELLTGANPALTYELGERFVEALLESAQ